MKWPTAGEDRFWQAAYDKAVAHEIDYPDMPLDAFLRQAAQNRPEGTALIYFNARISFRELDEIVDRMAAGLADQGVVHGDRVGIFMPNCPQFVIAFNAIMRLGAVAVLLNPLYVTREVCDRLLDCEAKAVVVLSRYYNQMRQACTMGGQTPRIIVTNIKDYFPPMLRLAYTLLREKREGDRVNLAGDDRAIWMRDLLRSNGDLPAVVVEPEDTAALVYTGGTTGVPKAAMLSHRNLVANAAQSTAWNAGARYGEDVMMTAIPLSHAYSLTVCMNQALMNAWAQVLLPDPRRIDDLLKAILKYRPTYFPAVPALYNAIANHPRVVTGKVRIDSIKSCISGAAGLPAEVQDSFQRLTGARLVEGYGLSEASPVACCNPLLSGGKSGTIGLPYPDTDIRILDMETETTPVGRGEQGVLCLRGPQVMPGYWNMPAETAEVLQPDGDGVVWLHTGDVVVQDEQGYLTLVDRKKEVIVASGGLKVFPREVEEVLYEHPAVLEAAVAGVPAESGLGDRVHAFIVLKPDMKIDEAGILHYCSANLAHFKVPKKVTFLAELPKSPVGKILRRQLALEEVAGRDGS
jgi:long-chain acyl-CoA synthetase